MLRIDSNLIDTLIFWTTLLTGIGGLISYVGLQEGNGPVEAHPFAQLMNYSRSIALAFLQLALAALLLLALLIRIFSKERSRAMLIEIMIIVSLALGLLPWVDLWYGYNFYQGETSLTQEPRFPVSSAVYLIYPLWLFQEKGKLLFYREFVIRLAASILIGLALTSFFNFVFGHWKLWVS